MQSARLRKLKNTYHTALGQIERDYQLIPHPIVSEKQWVSYKLNVRTLFNGYQAFLTANEKSDEDAYLDFFRDITAKGAPEEALAAATVFVASAPGEQKNHISTQHVKVVCDDWGINLNELLQFAVIEYITDMSGLGNETWHVIIKNLLKLDVDVDPNYSSDKFINILSIHQWSFPVPELKSAFNILISAPRITDNIHDFAVDFAAKQEKVGSKLKMREDQVETLFPKITKNFKSYPWLQWLEKNLPDKVKECVIKNRNNLTLALAKNADFESLDYLRKQYNFDPFTLLIETELEHKHDSLVTCPVFQYLEKTFTDKLIDYIKQNNEKFVLCFDIAKLAMDKKFDVIEKYKLQYALNPSSALLTFVNPAVYSNFKATPWLQWLEKNQPEQLKDYILANQKKLITELAFNHDFDSLDYLCQKYNINSFETLIEKELEHKHESQGALTCTLFRYIENTFKEKLFNFIKQNNDKMVQYFGIEELGAAKNFDAVEKYRADYSLDVFPIISSQLPLKGFYYPSSAHPILLDDPCFHYLKDKYFERLKKFIQSVSPHKLNIDQHVDNNDKKIDVYREVYGVDLSSVLTEICIRSQSPVINTPVFKYLEKHYRAALALAIQKGSFSYTLSQKDDYTSMDYFARNYHFVIEPNNIMSRISKELCNVGKAAKNLYDSQSFTWLDNIQPEAIRLYFRNTYHMQYYYDQAPNLLRNEKSFHYLAYQHNIDPLKFIIKNADDPKYIIASLYNDNKLNPYYRERAAFILKFICEQKFTVKDKPKSFTHAGKTVLVSQTMHNILLKLQNAANNKNPRKVFFEIVLVDVKSILDDRLYYTSQPDSIENQIYYSLKWALSDNSPLSEYVERQYDIKHCLSIPLSQAFRPKSKDCMLSKVTKKYNNMFLQNHLRSLVKPFLDGSKPKHEAKQDQAVTTPVMAASLKR